MSIGLLTILLFASLFTLLAIGTPIAFALMVVGTMFGLILWGPSHIYVLASATLGATSSQVLIAVPLFIFMGNILVHTGVARDMFKSMHYWTGPLKGSLAMGTIGIGAVFGAMCGSVSATTITIGNIALPSMLERGYDKNLVLGTVATSGLLAFLIPPSVLAIIWGSIAGVSIGKLYLGMFVPGFILAALYILYIGTRSFFDPKLGPPIPKEERPSWREKFVSLKGIVIPLLLVLAVIGGIYSGIATPTEAAGVGALAVVIAALITRSLKWQNFKQAVWGTGRVTAMVLWIMIGITIFTNVYNALGAPRLINEMLAVLPVSGFGVVIMMQVIIFFLGMVMDDTAIIMLTTPMFMPVIRSLGFDPLWFGVLYMVNLQAALMTPPYGFSLFLMRAITPKTITMGDIYRSAYPFVIIQLVCLVLVMAFPPLSTWLPALFIRK
jgi:tripartite ATP-independent transporter DctM subunit